MKTPDPSLVRAAARNNAEWCATMCRSHGVESGFGEQTWAAASRTPPYYPDAVTLVPGADPAALTARIDTAAPGATVKDGFADLDLTDAGFRVLFDAQWIHRPAPEPPAGDPALAWAVADDPGALHAWALAWDGGNGDVDLFRPELLADPDTFVLAGRSPDGRVLAGAVASRSDRVLGLSNVFTHDDGPSTAWPDLLDVAHSLFPALPVVGYEQGDDLAAALRHGFEPIGPLRIWIHPGPRPSA
ncbi:hypothetical protein [Streptomyces aureus]|uniref:hypothetical protein n=1 Tax=Streptomyces aureus TaxID=193461 RepID=UPI00056C6B00|nr:hypothetical protein [Streptomyces aureus]